MKTKNLILTVLMVSILCVSFGVQAKASKKQISGHLNLNTATAEQLDQLPGISPKKAQAIVDYRKDHPFKSPGDLDQVKGFSPKSIDKLKPYVDTDGPNNLAVEGGKKGKKAASSKKREKANKG